MAAGKKGVFIRGLGICSVFNSGEPGMSARKARVTRRAVSPLLFGSILFCLAPVLLSEEPYVIRVQAFYGKMMENGANPDDETTWRSSQEPRIFALREKQGAPDREWTTNVIEALMALADLQSVTDLFSANKPWNGKKNAWIDRFLGSDVAFRLETSIRMLTSGRAAFGIAVYRSKPGAIPEKERPETKLRKAIEIASKPKRMDQILAKELSLDFNDPVIISVPRNEDVFFVVLSLARSAPKLKRAESQAEKERPQEILEPPSPVRQVHPYYPDELRFRRIEGEVWMLVSSDKTGNVVRVTVAKSLHPYLDYAAVQAFLGWKFEPVFKNGKPVSVTFPYVYRFDRLSPKEERFTGEGIADEETRSVLDRAAEYCRRLAGSVLDYVCEETINEVRYQLRSRPEEQVEVSWITWVRNTSMGREVGSVSLRLGIMDPRTTEKNSYVCDYQLIKDGDWIKERRIILKANGRKIGGELYLEEKRFSALTPILAGVKLFSSESQKRFRYLILDRAKINGQPCVVVEARPIAGLEKGIELAKAWIEAESGRILKCEIAGVPLEGYEDVLSDCTLLNIHPVFIVTHQYGADYRGVSFPRRSSVRVEYPMARQLGGDVLKTTIDLKYSRHKYFTVKTDSTVIK